MTSVLDQATALLNREWAIRAHSVRAAAWVGRSALEETLAKLVEARGLSVGDANTRSVLGCIDALYADDDRIASTAQYAWEVLSRAAHQHAYDLSPTHDEVAAMLALVAELATLTESVAEFTPRRQNKA